MRIGIVAALPGELKPLVRGWDKLPVARGSGIRMWQTMLGEDEVVAVCAGMGAAAALRAFTAAEHVGSLDLVVSTGWAGGLDGRLSLGSVYVASSVIDARTGERTKLAEQRGDAVLVTTPHVASDSEKRRLAQAYGAAMVDMEAATIARLAQMRGIPFLAIKAISDELTSKLPDFNPFIDANGKLRLPAFIAHIAPRPAYWPALIRLGKASSTGANTLAPALFTFLTGPKNAARVNETGNID